MFSMKTVYGLKALQFLASKDANEHVLISEIAEHEKIPKKFLETILLTLKNEGLLTSKIGKGGGYQLAFPPASVTMERVVSALEGPLALVPCVYEDTGSKCEYCDDSSVCGVRLVMSSLTDEFIASLRSKTLQDMQTMTDEAVQNSQGLINYTI